MRMMRDTDDARTTLEYDAPRRTDVAHCTQLRPGSRNTARVARLAPGEPAGMPSQAAVVRRMALERSRTRRDDPKSTGASTALARAHAASEGG